jgi:hypothetical protein
MLPGVHARVTRTALEGSFGLHALDAIVAANVLVDAVWNQLGHDEFHFDNNAFGPSRHFMEEQRARIRPALENDRPKAAWQAFGRLTHTAQDFYSHSNYIDLWLACQPNGLVPAASEIDPLDDGLIENASLRSGRAYLPFGVLSFVPGLRKLVIPLLPRDSHARMNLDSAARGPLFKYAFEAAVKRTLLEFNLTARELPRPLLERFQALGDRPFRA